MRNATCDLCGRGGINPDVDYQRIVAYERRRSSGSASVVMREPLNRWAHRACIDLRRAGVNVQQDSMW